MAAKPLVVSAATPSPLTTTWSINYWQWMPSFGDYVTGTDQQIKALRPALMRVGGYNNDANTPDPFDDAAFDAAVAYARSVGAEPIIQVPHLADTSGQPPTPAEAAAIVTYANVTMGYGIKYFSVGNEPDIYADQGLPTDMTQPAIPGYTPAAYCDSTRAFVNAMKAADPSIQIVGPDLAFKYEAGSANEDWMTPILTTCGDLFDIISFHRYPFEAAAASLTSAQADAASFRSTVAMVRGILQSTGYSAKPLALTEMNIVYDATGCVLDASPGTVGSALWLADALGTAMELGLWTSAVWDISDAANYSLGLIGAPPDHTPEPEYYAYALFADHFGTELADVTAAPDGVAAHASRNAAGNATEIVAVNWNELSTTVSVQVTGLTNAPAPATFVLPAVSIAAIEIPDTGAASAWSYGEPQRAVAGGPMQLGAGPTSSDGSADAGGPGAGRVPGTNCVIDGGASCPTITPPNAEITAQGAMSGSSFSFGASSYGWGSYTYAGAGENTPTATVTSDGDGIHIVASFVPPLTVANNYEGVGLYLSGSSCLNASGYTGFEFDFAGSLGGCHLQAAINFSEDVSTSNDPQRGACVGTDSECYSPQTDLTAAALAATAAAPTVKVPFSSLAGGMPRATADAQHLIDVQWQLTAPMGGDAGACTADFSVENVDFY